MNTAMETVKSGELEPQGEAPSMLEVIARAAADPRVDVAKMEALLQMQERLKAQQAETAFSAAMARLQPKLPRITKLGRIMVNGQVRNTFARLEDIDEQIRPLYSEEGFSISWNTSTDEKNSGTRILGKLRHRDGHSEAYAIFLPNDNSGGKNGIQGVGSTVSYGRRYLLCSMFNVITLDQDTDGNTAEPIAPDQVNKIRDLIIHTKADEAKFCKYMDVGSVEEITADRFDMAMTALTTKARRS